jgi:hypothetical protein
MKIALIIVALVVVIIVAGFFLLMSNLDSLIASAIEKHGSEVTQTSVGVSGVELSLREGKGSIKGLRIGNPEGFKEDDAFTLDDITLDIDIQSLRDDPIVIDEIRISAPVVYAEALETGVTNIDVLRKNVEKSTGSGGGEGDSKKTEKRLRIKKFIFEEGRIEVDATALGIEKRTLVLPEIRLSDIGGPNGAGPDEITRIVLVTVAKEAASELAESGIKESIRKKLGDEAKGLLDKIGG